MEGAAPSRFRAQGAAAPTVLSAVSATSGGDLAHVVVVHPSEDGALSVLVVDVRAMILSGNTRDNVALATSDLLYVPKPTMVVRQRAREDAVRRAAVELATAQWGRGGALRALAYWMLHARTAKARVAAAVELAEHGTDGAGALPAVLQATHDDDAQVRREAVTLLGILGSRDALPRLRELVDDDDAQVEARAQAALRQIEEPPAPAKAKESEPSRKGR